MYKYHHSQLPAIFDNMFITNENIYTYSTRQRIMYQVPRCRLESKRNSLCFIGVRYFNTILSPSNLDIVYSRSICVYKMTLKESIFIRQTPGYLQKQPCHLPEETGVQLLCAASYDIWCRDMDTDQTSTEQTCGRTDKNGKKYAQHHIQRQKDQHLCQGEDKSHRYNQHCKKNEMVLGRAYQPPQR